MSAGSSPPRRVWPEGFVVDGVLFLVLLGLLPTTLALSTQARRMPLWVIGVALVLVALSLLKQLRAARAEPAVAPSASVTPHGGEEVEAETSRTGGGVTPADAADLAHAIDATEPDAAVQPPSGRRELVVLAWLIVAGVGIYQVGYLVTAPVFLVAFFLLNRVPWRVWIPTTGAVWAVMYFVFAGYLNL